MEKSESLKNIGKAITLFQTKMEKIKKDATNPFFKSKYATLSNILESIQLPLAESGLSFAQIPDGDCLTTILIHNESGEFLQGCYAIHAAKIDPQGIGSAITYARRYALSAILGVNVDDDDDGNAATPAPTYTNSKPAQEHRAGTIPPNQQEGGDNRPWLSEKEFNDVLAKVNGGDIEKFTEVKKSHRMKRAYRETLEGAENLSKALA